MKITMLNIMKKKTGFRVLLAFLVMMGIGKGIFASQEAIMELGFKGFNVPLGVVAGDSLSFGNILHTAPQTSFTIKLHPSSQIEYSDPSVTVNNAHPGNFIIHGTPYTKVRFQLRYNSNFGGNAPFKFSMTRLTHVVRKDSHYYPPISRPSFEDDPTADVSSYRVLQAPGDPFVYLEGDVKLDSRGAVELVFGGDLIFTPGDAETLSTQYHNLNEDGLNLVVLGVLRVTVFP